HGAAVLAPRRPPLPGPAALVALAPFPLSLPGRRAEHHAVGVADVLRPGPVPVLHAGAAAGRAVGPGRPGGRRHAHVGARLTGLPAATVRHRRRDAVWPGR